MTSRSIDREQRAVNRKADEKKAQSVLLSVVICFPFSVRIILSVAHLTFSIGVRMNEDE